MQWGLLSGIKSKRKLDAEGAEDPGTTAYQTISRQQQVQGDTVQDQALCPEPEVDNLPTPAEERPDQIPNEDPPLPPELPPDLSTPDEPPPRFSRAGRSQKPTQRMLESQLQRLQGIIAYQLYYKAMHKDDYVQQYEIEHQFVFLSTANKDTMYFDQAMKAPNSAKFSDICVKKVNDHIERKNCRLVPREDVSEDTKVLPSLWEMRQNRHVKTGKLYKHKARLNVHRGKQEYDVNYFDTYAPVVTWMTIRMVLVLAILASWAT